MERHPKASFPFLPLSTTTNGASPSSPSASPSSSLSIDGVFGFFDLPTGGAYLAVITDSEERYRGHGMEFRLVTKVTLVRVSNSSNSSASSGSSATGGDGTPSSRPRPPPLSTAAMLGDADEEEEEGGGGEEDEDGKQLELLRMAFRAHDLYFSPSFDVTLSAQRRATLGACVRVQLAGWLAG